MSPAPSATGKSAAGGAAFIILAACAAAAILRIRATQLPRRNQCVPQPIRLLDLTRYLGKWYELARYDSYFERGCEASTAEYTLLPDGKISIRNACRLGSTAGKLKVAVAKAKIVPGSGNAKLKVAFFGPFYNGDYWVLDHGDDYDWSVVGEPSGRYLWLLTRIPSPAAALRQHLLARAASLGYDIRHLRPTRQ